MYGVIGAGWTIVIYFLQILWDNIKTIMSTYQAYVVWYITITGTISFVGKFVYWQQPPLWLAILDRNDIKSIFDRRQWTLSIFFYYICKQSKH